MSGSAKAGIATAPPIPEHRKSVYEYYRLTFDEVGCPMKQTDSGMVFHPILAPYLIGDYTSLFEKTGDRSFLEYAVGAATAAPLFPLRDEKGAWIFAVCANPISTVVSINGARQDLMYPSIVNNRLQDIQSAR